MEQIHIIEPDDDEVAVIDVDILYIYVDEYDELDDDEIDESILVLIVIIVGLLDVIELDIELDDDEGDILVLILDEVDINE